MYDFESFAYLPLQKTGSTFVVRFLKRFCREQLRATGRHTPLRSQDYEPSKLYLISVRDPLDQYISLYSFGVQGSGGFYNQMRQQGYDALYDGTSDAFKLWLKLMLKPRNASLFERRYAQFAGEKLAKLVGYQSYRYLRLAVPSAEDVVRNCHNVDEVRAAFQQHNIAGFTLKTETLNADLATLVRTRLRDSITDVDEALRFLEGSGRANASERIDRYGQEIRLGEKLTQRLQEREWLLHELFGY